jgi:outer membrane protein assembly factor BamA
VVLNVVGSGYPGFWDVATPYESLDGWAAAFITLPMPKKPVVAVRGGGKKLWGNFPYFDAAFLGGSETFRTEERQRFAGDAALYGSAELRVPIAKFPLILPLDVGALGFVDAGRVYMDGQSPGGWHSAAGAGFWVGYLNPGTNFNVMVTNNRERRVTTNLGFAF